MPNAARPGAKDRARSRPRGDGNRLNKSTCTRCLFVSRNSAAILSSDALLPQDLAETVHDVHIAADGGRTSKERQDGNEKG